MKFEEWQLEAHARRMAKTLGIKIRRDSRERKIVVRHRGDRLRFPENDWNAVIEYLKRVRRDGV